MGEEKKEKKDKVEEPTPEEQKADEEALTEVKDEELRGKIAEDLGIDPEDEPELLDKIVKRETSQRKKLSGAIKQKISWREKAQKTSKKPKEKPEEGKPQSKEKPEVGDLVDQKLDEREAKRDLEDLNLPEELETEVKDLAKLKGIPIREAAKLPYIVSKIEEAKREERIKSATPKRSSKGTHVVSYDPSKPLNPDDFDLGSKKGIKAWKEAKAARRKYEKQQE